MSTDTVGFVYKPQRESGKMWGKKVMEREHMVITERNAGPLNGFEIIGATLLSSRSDIPIRWFDCVLSVEDARKVK